MVKCKRLHITLIELLLVISVLLMVAGVVGFNIRGALVEQRFRAEVSAVVDSLRLAQDLMLILNSDVHVFFADDPAGGIRYWVEVEKPLAPGWDRELKRKRPNLTAIHLVEMDDKISTIQVQDRLDIKFLSGGSIMSKGVLGLFSGDDKNREDVLKSSICLPGYPKPIESLNGYRPEDCLKEGEDIDLATRDMLSEIQPRLKKTAESIIENGSPDIKVKP